MKNQKGKTNKQEIYDLKLKVTQDMGTKRSSHGLILCLPKMKFMAGWFVLSFTETKQKTKGKPGGGLSSMASVPLCKPQSRDRD